MIRFALVHAAAGQDVQANITAMEPFVSAAAAQGCKVICFPECFVTGYAPEEAQSRSIRAEDPQLTRIDAMAREAGLDILTGFMEKEGSSFYITHGLFRRDGTRGYYRKTHLGSREQRFFRPGEELKVLTLTGGEKIGIQICVETHYPQITQTLALRDAEIIFAPHAVPRASGDRQHIWGKYIPARSYDNRVYMACCNLWDPERFGGGCLVTGPRGETLASCYREESSLLVCDADLAAIAAFRDPDSSRSRHFYPGLRKPELYD